MNGKLISFGQIVAWCLFTGYLALVCLYWLCTSNNGTAIGQCVLAAQSAALAVIGYGVVRAATECLKCLEKIGASNG